MHVHCIQRILTLKYPFFQENRNTFKNTESSSDLDPGTRNYSSGKRNFRIEVDDDSIDFRAHLLEVLQPEFSLDPAVTELIDSMLKDLFHRLALAARRATLVSRSVVMTQQEVQLAVELVLPRCMAVEAIRRGQSALGDFVNSD